VVEVVSGQALDDYLAAQVFGPLAMQDSGFFVPEDRVARLARPYQAPQDSQPLSPIEAMDIPITSDPPLLEGAAGLVSTVPDYLRFLQSLLAGGELDGQRILGADTVAQMTRNQIDEALFPFGTNPANPMLDRGWGYGLAVVTDATQSEFGVNNGEFGWNGSLGTFSWADPETGTVAILMLQIQPSNAHGLAGEFKDLVYHSLDVNR
jgi:CubicO group peptidase (beta-lactamase class C family)